jgi:hypothetical protein
VLFEAENNVLRNIMEERISICEILNKRWHERIDTLYPDMFGI